MICHEQTVFRRNTENIIKLKYACRNGEKLKIVSPSRPDVFSFKVRQRFARQMRALHIRGVPLVLKSVGIAKTDLTADEGGEIPVFI